MGMYHYYSFDLKLKDDLPEEVIKVLNYFSEEYGDELIKVPKHHFFLNSRWQFFSVGSCYNNEFKFEDNYLFAKGCVKNYDSVIEEFVDFINPYIDAPIDTIIGKMVFEEFYDDEETDDSHYTKFYKKDK